MFRVYFSSLCGQQTASYLVLCVILLTLIQVHCVEHHLESDHSRVYYDADIRFTYKDSQRNDLETENIQGSYGLGYMPTNANMSGKLVHVISVSSKDRAKSNHFGCEKYSMKLPTVKWIALVERGECDFTEKLQIATIAHNASAVIVYNNLTTDLNYKRHRDVKKNVAVFISREDGLALVKLLDKDINVEINIRRGQRRLRPEDGNKNNSSVLFLSISFSIVVIIAVAWLMYYYIRKFRYSHAKERLAKRLARAAKKAIAKIPQRTLNVGDKELEGDFDQCAVCIEPYKDGDVIRLMPCRHVFHKSCVDPWLLDHRTCPMCKLDILQAFGMSMGKLDILAYGMQASQESVHGDMEEGAIMLASIPSVDGGGRSESTGLVLDDHEASSSLEDESQENSEFKLVLVPPSCLHYHHHSSTAAGTSRSPGAGGVLEEDEEEDVEQEASTSLLANSGAYAEALKDDVSATHISTGSLNSSSGRNNKSGWRKSQGQAVGENSVETEALIHPSMKQGDDVRVGNEGDIIQQSAAKENCKESATHQANRSLERKSSDPCLPNTEESSGGLHSLPQQPTSHEKQSDV
ncbi:hypothetical protein EGW08_014952 [Elysia chlorotica]|uniref:RING-type domain-containing protein n=1 Tax=Elysia chlorotica TaxID=188477 RepID=A0A3S0ZKZ4_ELYCH|nr:hypothetical protein EGW08_014952 [Elysia chlorotica]